jgi:hypothetical protein
MAIYRVDLLVHDPEPVFEWIDTHVPKEFVIRTTAVGHEGHWSLLAIFKRPADAEAFLREWAEGDDHGVAPWTSKSKVRHLKQKGRTDPPVVPHHWLKERIVDLETLHAEEPECWSELTEHLETEDEIWRFDNAHTDDWRRLAGRAGYCIVRNGKPVFRVLTFLS